MNLFRESRKNLAFAGLGTAHFVQIAGKNIPRSLIRCVITFVLLLATILEGIVCMKGYALNLVGFLGPFCIWLCFLSTALIYISLVFKTNKISDLFKHLENVVDTRSQLSSESGALYETRNTTTEKITETVFSFALQVSFVIHAVPTLFPLLYLAFGYPSTDLWLTPYAIQEVSPFFGKTPLGFGIIVPISYSIAITYVIAIKAFTKIYIGISTNIEAIADDVSMNIDRLNKAIDNHQGISMMNELKRFIELHKDCYRLMEMLEDVISEPIFFLIAVFPLQFSILLFEIELNITTISFIVVTYMGGLTFLSILNFLLCFFVTTATINAMQIGDEIFDLNWYKLPCNEQLFILLVLQRAQKPLELRGLGFFTCSLATFLKMVQSALSYYMVFRQL